MKPVESRPEEMLQLILPVGENFVDPRTSRIEQWKKTPANIISYNDGIDAYGNVYKRGQRLLIADQQVMDTCETPWAIATVREAFEALRKPDDEPIRVLERGFGLGIAARWTIRELLQTGGEYHVIELNEDVAKEAKQWKKSTKEAFNKMSRGIPTGEQIDIKIYEGDAAEVTAKLAEMQEKFDIIISDTFPLDEDELGMNDIQDLEVLKTCLNPGGVFTFFAFFPGSTGGVVKKQENIINRHFKSYRVSEVAVNPPPDYQYLQGADGPVQRLPVVVCTNPRLG